MLAGLGHADQHQGMRRREQGARRQVEILLLRPREHGAAGPLGALQRGVALDVLVLLAVARPPLVEAVGLAVLAFPGDEVGIDVDRLVLLVLHAQLVALLDRPAVAALAPLVGERAGGADHAAVRLGAFERHVVKRPVRLHLDRMRRRRRDRGPAEQRQARHHRGQPSHRALAHAVPTLSRCPSLHPATLAAAAVPAQSPKPRRCLRRMDADKTRSLGDPIRPEAQTGLPPLAGGRLSWMCSSFNRAAGTGDGACISRSWAC